MIAGVQLLLASKLSSAGNHSFRASEITAYLKSDGTLEKAAAMANWQTTLQRARRNSMIAGGMRLASTRWGGS